ncbi:MAG: ABC transporter substrate-binding protein [Mycetocola sp.]
MSAQRRTSVITRKGFARAVAAAAVGTLAIGLSACAGTPADQSGDNNTAQSDTVTPGKLTIATGEPAYYPWVIDDDPESGEGFESAVAWAVADELGYDDEDVVWVRSTFEESIAPGPKDFDINLQQFSITEERAEAVDFSSPYYETTQVVISVEGSPAADVDSLDDLTGLLVGAQTGTTSLSLLEDTVELTEGAQVFSTNDDAKLALQSGTVDAIVVDLPTAFYLTGVELDGGVIVGQLPPDESAAGDQFGFVLEKDSPLTADVTAAVDELRADGTLDALAKEWLAEAGDAPVLQ